MLDVGLVELYKSSCRAHKCREDKCVLAQLTQPGVIKHLDLTRTYVGPIGFPPVLDVIKACMTLDTISLVGNGLDNASITALCQAVKGHPSMTSLDISRNPITFLAGRALLELVEANERLVSVTVDDTDIYDILVDRIELSVAENRKTQLTQAATAQNKLESLNLGEPSLAATRAPTSKTRAVHQSESVPSGVILTKPSVRRPIPAVASNAASRIPASQLKESIEKYKARGARHEEGIMRAKDASYHTLLQKLEVLERQEVEAEETKRVKVEEPKQAAPEILASLSLSEPSVPIEVAEDTPTQKLSLLQLSEVEGSKTILLQSPVDVPATSLTAAGRPMPSNCESLCPPASSTDPPENMRGTLERLALLSCYGDMEKDAPQDAEVSSSSESLEGSQVEAVEFTTRKVPSFRFRHSGSPPRGTSPDMCQTDLEAPVANLTHLCQTDFYLPMTESDGPLEVAFKTKINEGSNAFGERNMEGALKAWSSAIDIANDAKRMGWITMVSARLQRLSFKALVLQGEECMRDRFFPEAFYYFTRALDVAQRVGNPDTDWVKLVQEKMVSVRIASFQRSQSLAADIIYRMRGFLGSHEYVDSVMYMTRTGIPSEHCKAFLSEWDFSLAVRKLFLYQQEGLTQVQPPEDFPQEVAEVHQLFRDAFKVRLQHMARPEDSVTPRASHLFTSALIPYERSELVRIHSWILHASRALGEKRWIAITQTFLGNLHLADYQVSKAITAFEEAKAMLEGEGEPILEALLDMYHGASHALQRSYSVAEPILTALTQRFKELRCDETLAQFMPFLAQCQFDSYNLLLECLVMQGRYTEALEAVEQCRNEHHWDLMYRKICLNFSPKTTLANMQRVAYVQTATLVHVCVLNRPVWNEFSSSYTYEEKVYLWAVPRSGNIKFVLTEPKRLLPKEITVHSLVQDVQTRCISNDDSADNAKLREALQGLFKVLVEPVYDFLEICAESGPFGGRVIFIPDPLLWHVPFGALLTEGAAFDNRPDTYLAERFVISIAPSITFVVLCSINSAKNKARLPQRRVLWSASPGAEEGGDSTEAAIVAQLLKAEIISGVALDPTVIQTITPTVNVMHIVAPLVNRDGMSGFVVPVNKSNPNGLVSLETIEGCDLPAQVVGLGHHVCGPLSAQHGMVECMVRAFVASGVASVISTVCSDPRIDIQGFFADVYERLTMTNETTTAVTAALRMKISEHRSHPIKWVGFFVCGVDS